MTGTGPEAALASMSVSACSWIVQCQAMLWWCYPRGGHARETPYKILEDLRHYEFQSHSSCVAPNMSFALQVTRQSLCPSETCLHSKSKAADLQVSFGFVWSPHMHTKVMCGHFRGGSTSSLSICLNCCYLLLYWYQFVSVHLGDVPRPVRAIKT